MKNKIILFVLLSCVFAVNAQVLKLNKQKIQYSEKWLYDSLKIQKPNFKETAVEVRLCYMGFTYDTLNSYLLQIKQDTYGEWHCTLYKFFYWNYTHYDFKNAEIYKMPVKLEWKKQWKTIIKKKYLNLPSEYDVKIECKADEYGLKPVLAMSGGESYVVEVFTKKRMRRMQYNSPQDYYDFYKKECNFKSAELSNFLDFIEILKGVTTWNLTPIGASFKR